MEQIRVAVLTPYDKVLAFLDNTVPSAMHYFDETLHTYLKGSSYTFEFTTMTAHDDAAFLVEGNKLSFKRKNKDYYLTIMNVEKGGDETKVTAYGLCLELTNEYVGEYKATKAMSFAEYVNVYGFEQSFVIGKNEVSDKRITHEWTGDDTVLARLYSIANVFDAELEFVTQLNDDYSLKRVVLNVYRAHSDSAQGMGTDKRSTILRYPNNIYGITKTSDITELYTAIRPTGRNGLQLNSISGRVVKDSNGNVLYKVGDNNLLAPQARDRFPSTLKTNHNNDMYIAKIWSYDTDNVEVLYGQALAELKKNCVPKVTYDVDAYIDADIGDTFMIEDAEYSPTLYLEARITEQEICFTGSEKCKTIFDNFEEKQSQISSALISEMNKMIELKKVYEGSIVSSNGVLFKTDSDSTKLTALVKNDGVDITSKYSIIWYKDDVQISTNQTITISASDFTEKAVYRFKAMSGGMLKASAEVTVMRLQDGQNGTSAYVHIAYANSSDGRVDFSLTDSNRKFIGQYSDSNQYGSEDPTKYRWSAIKGEDGQSFVSAEEQFYYSTSQTELIGGEWFVGNVVYQSDKFLWKRWKCTYANPSEIKYTKAIFDNTWNEIEAKIGEIHTQVSQTNTQSKEALGKAEDAEKLATSANELANTANTQSSEAKKLAQDANTSTGNALKQIDAIKGDITDSKQQIQDAVDKANANATEINSVKETYATKVDLSNSEKTIKADVSTEITKQIGELSTNISESYAAKTDLVTLEGSLKSEIKQNADNISSTVSRVESLETDTTQAKKDVADAIQKATAAKETADSAQADATAAKETADKAQSAVDEANKNLSTAQNKLTQAEENLTNVTGRVDATEKEIVDAKKQVADAQAKVTQAQKDVESAKETANTAVSNAKTAQDTANDAKTKAEKAQQDVDNLTSRVTTAESKITQNEKSISLAVSETTKVNQKVDNLQIGGRNLLRNTAFNTFKYWNSINAKLEVVDGWCEVTINGTWSSITQNFKPEKGVDYIISYEAYLVDTEATSAFLECDFGSPDDKLAITKTPTKYSKKIPYPTDVANFINFQLLSEEVGKKWRIRNIKLEKGNKATDWTPAPEDVDNDLATTNNNVSNLIHTTTDLSAQLNVTKQSIQSNVSEISQIQNNIATMKKETSTSIEQTNKSISAVISSTNILQEKVNGSNETIKNINTNFGFDAEGMTIGKSDSHFKTKISNERFSFTENGNEVAYFANKKMYITDGQFTNSMRVGDFAFVPRANGSLDFKKVGGGVINLIMPNCSDFINENSNYIKQTTIDDITFKIECVKAINNNTYGLFKDNKVTNGLTYIFEFDCVMKNDNTVLRALFGGGKGSPGVWNEYGRMDNVTVGHHTFEIDLTEFNSDAFTGIIRTYFGLYNPPTGSYAIVSNVKFYQKEVS